MAENPELLTQTPTENEQLRSPDGNGVSQNAAENARDKNLPESSGHKMELSFNKQTIDVIENMDTGTYRRFIMNPLLGQTEKALIKYYRTRAKNRECNKRYRAKKLAQKSDEIEAIYKFINDTLSTFEGTIKTPTISHTS